ncbi:MAG: tRNA lysidine(34) synthetase TilS [Pseudomonadota bacterium]
MPAPEAELLETSFAALDRLTEGLTGPLGIAVSGGSDSTALTVITAEWAQARGRLVSTATVDHRLRPESRAEAVDAGLMAQGLGLEHQILDWDHADPNLPNHPNLMTRARQVRHSLLGNWAREQGLSAVLLGHTQDDQAETVLMRLLRGSGVDGLSGITEKANLEEMLWLRPLLSVRRTALQGFLTARGIRWSNDPSNDDPEYDRVQIRQTMRALELSPEGLAATAETLARQRRVLERDRDRLADAAVKIGALGEVYLDPEAFAAAETDTCMAVLADAICWIGGLAYRPRYQSLKALWQSLGIKTLGGVLSDRSRKSWMLCRELAHCPEPGALTPITWDHRWALLGPKMQDISVRALGEDGHSHLKRQSHIGPETWQTSPRRARLVVPSFWRRDTLLGVPAAGFHDEEWGAESPFRAVLKPPPARFRR